MSERASDLDYLDVLSQPSGEPELAAQASKKKRKMSRKQRAAALKNLAKANTKREKARRAKVLKKSSKAARPYKSKAAKAVVKARRAAHKGARVPSRKQHAAAKRNIKKAQLARRMGMRKGTGKKYGMRRDPKTHRLTPRRHARSTQASEAKAMKKGKGKRKTTRKQREAARKNIKKAQAKLRSMHRKGKKSSGKKKTLAKRSASRAVRPPTPKKAMRRGKGKRRFTQKARDAAMRNLRKARAARAKAKRAGRKHPVRAYSYHSKPKRVKVPAHRSYEKRGHQSRKARAASLRNLKKARAALRHGGRRHSGHRARETYMEAMVNALTGTEIVIGAFTMTFWFMVTDFVDRLVATHALTDKGTKDASGHELYADTPPTSGDYAGLFNATAICAPMNVWRWVVGLGGMTGVPFLISFAVSNDVGRSALQAASAGAGIRIVGKALIDLVAYITMWNPLGQQLYDGEMRAQVYASGNTDPLTSLPSTGLGGTEKKAGTGEAPKDKDGKVGTAWPSMPRETANAGSTATTGGNEGGAPPPPAPGPQASQPGYLAGLPPKRKSMYEWALREESVAA